MQRFCLVVITIMLSVCSHAYAENRVALVIGNGAYQHVPALPNPGNDAEDVAIRFQEFGFEVVAGLDLDLDGVKEAIRTFAGKLDGADLAVFYYAGHGLQVNGQNYIIPVDARLRSFIDLSFEAVPMELVLSTMERTARVNLVFLDACRDNPLAENLALSMGTRSSSVGRGLAKIDSGVGTLVAFATQPGNVALDGTGRNSPFTGALLRHMGKAGRDVTRELVDVRRDVLESTNGQQVPWDSSSLTEVVVLRQQLPGDAGMEPPFPSREDAAEIAFWETIKASNSRGDFEAYLSQFPNGVFALLARARIQHLADEAESRPSASLAPDLGKGDPMAKSPEPELVRSLQKELNRLGCRAGREDGQWGDGSRRALEQFGKHSKAELQDQGPSGRLLEELRTHRTRVCPLVCLSSQQQLNGRCVALTPPKAPTAAVRPAPAPVAPAPFAGCPSDAQTAARDTFARGSGRGRTARKATHACGREFVCHRQGRRERWTCNWS